MKNPVMYLSGVTLSNIKDILQEVIEINLKRIDNGVKQEMLTLLTRQDTAKALCISLPTLNQWTKEGVIKAHRIGNRVLYRLEDINDALTEVKTSVKRGGKSC
ncbi:helix-turn-helix domain-containing protein [Aestuariibaculum sp. YM273]|uniref:helix-turn-helix domain-containing protein n=1 Tax=Aestuariibaculum sp. YM273 TaxID=3070659 RepID=UPI0027DE2D86|nr:helix-turn-helix domain-containing protein [Aestuariibaculum sp. YM273]WMI66718.1 helix-turn-helix domain-containing protein [Aestuariibaculum sp. YM273]